MDCSTDKPPQLAEGTLVIVILLQPAELLEDMKGFLRSLGMLLHTNLRLKLDEKQEPMVYPYYGIEDNDNLQTGASFARLGKRELGTEVIGYVCLNLNCVEKCFCTSLTFFYFSVQVKGVPGDR